MLTPEQIAEIRKNSGLDASPSFSNISGNQNLPGKYDYLIKDEEKKYGVLDYLPAFLNPSKQKQYTEEAGTSLSKSTGERVDRVKGIVARTSNFFEPGSEGQGAARSGLQAFGEVAGGAGDLIFEGLKFAAKKLTPEVVQDYLGAKAQQVLEQPKMREGLMYLSGKVDQYNSWEEENPQLAADLRGLLGVVDVVTTFVGAGSVAKGLEKGGLKAAEIAGQAGDKALLAIARGGEAATSGTIKLFTKEKTAAQVINTLDKTYATLKTAEEVAPDLTIKEKWVGLRPDIKKRIAGKVDQLKEYFNVAHTRNLDDTAPTAWGYAGNKVKQARNEVEKVLNDTGSDIGKFRDKVKTVQIPRDSIDGVFASFDNELLKLNLEVSDGQISRIQGKVAGLATDGDIKTLQKLYGDLQVLSQSPTVENVIDNRMAFDSYVNFAKSAKEASNSIDPIARNIRSKLAEINRTAIGKEQSQLLKDYSELREALGDMNSYVDRRAGSEYLLRLVYSGRGEEAKDLLLVVKKYTGIDLMDDAQMAKIATELIANKDQMNLFRQEITAAGLDASSILSAMKGNPTGLLLKAGMYASEKAIPAEKVFLEAAQEGSTILPKAEAAVPEITPVSPKTAPGKAIASAAGKVTDPTLLAEARGKTLSEFLIDRRTSQFSSFKKLEDLTNEEKSILNVANGEAVVYRGIDTADDFTLRPGDFVGVNNKLVAEQYGKNVKKFIIPADELLYDTFGGPGYGVYNPKKGSALELKDQLTSIWNEANAAMPKKKAE